MYEVRALPHSQSLYENCDAPRLWRSKDAQKTQLGQKDEPPMNLYII